MPGCCLAVSAQSQLIFAAVRHAFFPDALQDTVTFPHRSRPRLADAAAGQIQIHRIQHLAAQAVLLQQMAEVQDRGLVRRQSTAQIDARKAPQHRRFIQRVLYRQFREREPGPTSSAACLFFSLTLHYLPSLRIGEFFGGSLSDQTPSSLRRNDTAHSMPPRQNNAAMIDLRRRCRGFTFGQARALRQRSAAGRAPVGLGIHGEHGMALAANALHTERISQASSIPCQSIPRYLIHVPCSRTLNPCTLPCGS